MNDSNNIDVIRENIRTLFAMVPGGIEYDGSKYLDVKNASIDFFIKIGDYIISTIIYPPNDEDIEVKFKPGYRSKLGARTSAGFRVATATSGTAPTQSIVTSSDNTYINTGYTGSTTSHRVIYLFFPIESYEPEPETES